MRSPRVQESGQATVEYLLVGLALLATLVALAALWHAVVDGGFQDLMRGHASHALGQMGGAADVFLY